MENTNSERELACILFPGVVKDEERAIQCMGGLKYISQVYSKTDKKRLGLSFQPENPYMKRIFATMKRASGALLRVRVKKRREGGAVKREVISTDVLGRVTKIFEFDSLCDFQYMPVQRPAPAQPWQCLLDHLPTGLDDVSCMEQPAPLLITPANFTRADHPFNYCYTEKRYITGAGAVERAGRGERAEESEAEGEAELHSRLRKMRNKPVLKYEFNLVDEFPSAPHKVYLSGLHTFIAQCPPAKEQYETLQKCFEERPIWSQNLLKYKTGISGKVLKVLLPCVAFHLRSGPWRSLWLRYGYDPRADAGAGRYQVLDFRLRHRGEGIGKVLLPCVAFHLRSGPWRSLWLRYGYDPRADAGAGRYQVLDFRLRHRGEGIGKVLLPCVAFHLRSAGVHTLVRCTREQASNWRRADRVKYSHKRSLTDHRGSGGGDEPPEVTESVVCFRPGLVPAQRQTFFMYADIDIPEVQAMVGSTPPPGALCHPSRGWLPPHADSTARDLIFHHVREAAFANHQATVSLERVSTDDDSNSEADPSSADEMEPQIKPQPKPQEPQTEPQKLQIELQLEPQPSTSYS